MGTTHSADVGKILRKRYLLALSIIAFLVLLSQGIIQLAIHSQQDDSRIINIAGRQRMLSQRINKAAFGLYISDEQSQRTRYSEELTEALNLWKNSHIGLQNGDPILGLPGDNSVIIMEMFRNIEPQHQIILRAATAIQTVVADPDYDKALLADSIKSIQENETAFLAGMDAIVFQYDKESKAKIQFIKLTEAGILVSTLFTLAIEMLFIFIPVQREIEVVMEETVTSRNNLEMLFETAPAAMFLIDGETLKIIKANHQAKEIIEITEHDEKAMALGDLLEYKNGNVKDIIDRIVAGVTVENAELVLKTRESLSMVVLMSSQQINYDEKRTILMGLADITRLKEAEEVLKRYATVDDMTGLLNKRSGMLLLENTFDRTCREGGAMSVAFIDIDGLKTVNDNYGHEEGDLYIVTVSDAIKRGVSGKDPVFRYGGDEIVVVLDGCDATSAQAVLLRITERLDSACVALDKPYPMHISYGIAACQDHRFASAEEMLTMADRIMYENKRAYKQGLV